MKRFVLILSLTVFLVAVAGCTSTQKGAVIGTGAGAAVGAIIGEATGSNTAVAASVSRTAVLPRQPKRQRPSNRTP